MLEANLTIIAKGTSKSTEILAYPEIEILSLNLHLPALQQEL